MLKLLLSLDENLYLKDPQSTDLGSRIVHRSIHLIDSLGFEKFTFRKLSEEIDSTEASVYRYFENKHRLLAYLLTWYWAWLDYRIEYETHHLDSPTQKLDRSLKIITEKKVKDDIFPNIDEEALQRIVISESDKLYLTKQVDEDNKEGLFRGYKSLCRVIADLIKVINPTFPYPHALVSTAIEAANQQIFFANHLPSLTELSGEANPYDANYTFLKSFIYPAIGVSNE